MQYVAIIAAVLALFKDTFSGLFKSREVKFVLIGLGAYLLYRSTKKKEEKENILSNLADNEAGLLAQRLHAAFHPTISTPIFGWYPPDGTDETAIKSIAVQMGTKRNYAEVSQAFTLLFSQSLDEELRSEGVFDTFFNVYNAKSGSSVTPTTPTTTPTQNNTIKVKFGSEAYLTQANVNIRSTDGKILRSSKKGEYLGKVTKIETKTVAGITSTWATCDNSSWYTLSTYTMVSAQYLTTVKP